MRRAKGSGSLFLRGDGLWVGRVTVPTPRGEARQREQVTSRRFCDALRKLSDAHPFRPEFIVPATPRIDAMRAARERGRHTAQEWYGLVRSVKRRCFYCDRECAPWGPWRMTKDHKTPVSRGGSDAIDNLAVACKQCNSQKSNLTAEEFLSMWRPKSEGWAAHGRPATHAR